MVSEQFIPKLTSIYLNPTERCNLRCQHCWLSPEFYSSGFTPVQRAEKELNVQEIESIVKQSLELGLMSVKLTGGEPFLRNDIHEIVELIKKYKLYLHIETNGTIINRSDANFLKKLRVDRVSISLDSTEQSTYESLRGVMDSFERAVNSIKLLVNAGISVEIIMSLFKQNINDFPYVLRLARKLGVKTLKLNTIIPTGRGAILYKKRLVPDIDTLIAFNKKLEQQYLHKDNINIHLSIPPAFKSIKGIVNDGDANCRILNILGILSNGDISICGIGRVEKSLVLGNVKKDKIRDIWFNNNFLKSLRKKLPTNIKGICRRCLFRNTCIGFCRANAYSVSKDIFAPYWFCSEAYNTGLFPLTRLM
jgi:SynChlorMet cassette radical SAM/SPASM protein ScmF